MSKITLSPTFFKLDYPVVLNPDPSDESDFSDVVEITKEEAAEERLKRKSYDPPQQQQNAASEKAIGGVSAEGNVSIKSVPEDGDDERHEQINERKTIGQTCSPNRYTKPSAIPKILYDHFVQYLQTNILPSQDQLCNPDTGGKIIHVWQFKVWAQNFTFSPQECLLVHKKTGRFIVPKEDFRRVIKEAHESTRTKKKRLGCIHLSLRSTMAKLQKLYTFGLRYFGMTEEMVKSYVQCCEAPNCTYKVFFANSRPKIPKPIVMHKSPRQARVFHSPKRSIADSLKIKYMRFKPRKRLTPPTSPNQRFIENLAESIWLSCKKEPSIARNANATGIKPEKLPSCGDKASMDSVHPSRHSVVSENNKENASPASRMSDKQGSDEQRKVISISRCRPSEHKHIVNVKKRDATSNITSANTTAQTLYVKLGNNKILINNNGTFKVTSSSAITKSASSNSVGIDCLKSGGEVKLLPIKLITTTSKPGSITMIAPNPRPGGKRARFIMPKSSLKMVRRSSSDEVLSTSRNIKPETIVIDDETLEETKQLESLEKINDYLNAVVEVIAHMKNMLRPAYAGSKIALQSLNKSIDLSNVWLRHGLQEHEIIFPELKKCEENEDEN